MAPVAVIGAGLAGLACGRALVAAGVGVTLFDKGRAPGGRVATRRSDGPSFDHGGAVFAARRLGFATMLAEAEAGEAVAAGKGGYAGTPSASALPRFMAQGLDIRVSTLIRAITGHPGQWYLLGEDDAQFGPFQAVVVAVPAPQAVALLAHAPLLAQRAQSVRYAPCWTIMAAFDQPTGMAGDAPVPPDSPIGAMIVTTTKAGGETWVLHATAPWSRDHEEDQPAQVLTILLTAFAELGSGRVPFLSMAHRWRYAFVEQAAGGDMIFDPVMRLGICGDWCLGAMAEDAFDSGQAVARAIVSNRAGQ